MRVAVIPARGGSKRIPRKNIRVFSGKPIISWPIEIALASHLFDHVVASTDDDEIAEIARNSGAMVPFVIWRWRWFWRGRRRECGRRSDRNNRRSGGRLG